MEPKRYRHYIGIDWATEAHRICLLDHNGQLCAKKSIPHSGAGLGQPNCTALPMSCGRKSSVLPVAFASN